MFRELLCVIMVLITSVIPSQKLHTTVFNFVDKTFVIYENTNDNMKNQAVKVFSNSEALLKSIKGQG